MENPTQGRVSELIDEQYDATTQDLEKDPRTTASNLELLSDYQPSICIDSTSNQPLLTTKHVSARQSAFLSLDESDEEGTDGSSSLYSRPIHSLVETASPAPALPVPGTPRSLVISSPYCRGPVSPDVARNSHQIPPTPNSRREVSFWSKTSLAISYAQCRLCSEYDGVDGFIQCQCGEGYCHTCAKDLLLTAALGDSFRPPCCCCCGQQIPLDLFLPYIDPELESLLRTKYNDIPQPAAFKEIPKGCSQKWKQFHPFHRLTGYIVGCGRTSGLTDASFDKKERKKFNTWNYLGPFRKYTTEARVSNSKCSHSGKWYTLHGRDSCHVCGRPSATHLCKCHHCGILMCPGCRQREIGLSNPIIIPSFPTWPRFSAIFDRYHKA